MLCRKLFAISRIILDDSDADGSSITSSVVTGMMENVPESFGNIAWSSQLLDGIIASDPELAPARKQLASVWIVGNKVDTVYTGLESQGLCSVRAQIQGGRLIVVAAVDELLAYFQETRIKCAIDRHVASSRIKAFFLKSKT